LRGFLVCNTKSKIVSMTHRGECVERAVRASGMSLAELARRMKKSRRHVYNIFLNPNVPLDEVMQIGRLIHYDFSVDFQELRSTIQHQGEPSMVPKDESAEYWKNKYVHLLEKYNALLELKSGM